MRSIDVIIKKTALFSIGALVGAFSQRWLAGFLKNRMWATIFGLVVVMAGAYIDNEYASEILIGFGLNYVAKLLG